MCVALKHLCHITSFLKITFRFLAELGLGCWAFFAVSGRYSSCRAWSPNRGGVSLQSVRASVVAVHSLSCPTACSVPDQGLNLCALHWWADSSSLDHQGLPRDHLLITKENSEVRVETWQALGLPRHWDPACRTFLGVVASPLCRSWKRLPGSHRRPSGTLRVSQRDRLWASEDRTVVMRLWLGSQDIEMALKTLLPRGGGLRSASCRSLSVCRPCSPRPCS